MKRVAITIFLFYSAAILLFSQYNEPFISFEKERHDFGKIKEENGLVKFKFQFTNTGSTPLIIQNVKPSCGCTTPEWNKEPVKPGGTGYISATYNPQNRPGRFDKTISVYTNTDKGVIILHIEGEVLPREKTLEEIYRINISGVRLTNNNVSLGKVFKGSAKSKEIEMVNTLQENASITFRNVPAYVTLDVIPEVLKPNEKGKILIHYDTEKNSSWGHNYSRMTIVVNEEYKPNNRLTISANIVEDFSKLTPEEKANAPRLEFEQAIYNYGTIKQGDVVNHDFIFTNTGKSDLIIRNVKAGCGCTAGKPEKNMLKPGESSLIKASFNSRGRKGSQSKSITVISNDPEKSMQILYLKGIIEVPAKSN